MSFTSPTTTSTGTTGTTGTTAASASRNSMPINQDQFLQMLMAELKNQNPLTVSFANIEGTGNLDSTVGFSWTNASSGGKVFDLAQTNAVSLIQGAINNISSLAATLGAVQNRLQYTSNAISVTQENMSSSLSNIQDVNMATEMTQMTQQQVLQQAGTAMLAQANSQPQLVLKLITG